MSLSNLAIKEHVDKIINGKQAPVNWEITAEIITPDEVFLVHNVVSRRVVRDYQNELGDSMMIVLDMPITIYRTHLFPNMRNLKISITWTLVDNKGVRQDAPEKYVRKYLAYLTDPQDALLMPSGMNQNIDDQMAIGNMFRFGVQCVHPSVKEMSTAEVGGIFSEATVSDMLLTHMSYGLGDSETKSKLNAKTYDMVRGLDLKPPSNEKVYKQLIIPAHTRLMSLPFLLQKKYGVYAGGLGCYFQTNYTSDDAYQEAAGGWWWVYPIYDYTRFETDERTLTLYLANPDEIADIEKSFSYFDKQLFVISTGRKVSTDYTEYSFHENGNGRVYAKSSELVDGLFEIKDNVAASLVDDTKKEVIIKEREDGINDVRVVDGYYTDNLYPQLSKLTSGIGKQLACIWTNASPDLLFPGMSVKVLHMVNSDVVEAYGTLVSVSYTEKTATDSIKDKSFITVAELVIQMENA